MKNILKKIGFRYMDLAARFVLGVALVNICLLQPIGILQLVLWVIMKIEIRSMKKEFNAETEKQQAKWRREKERQKWMDMNKLHPEQKQKETEA